MIAYMPELYHAKQKIDNKIQDFYTFNFNPIAAKDDVSSTSLSCFSLLFIPVNTKQNRLKNIK